jgi:UDP-glucose 4-epimerase
MIGDTSFECHDFRLESSRYLGTLVDAGDVIVHLAALSGIAQCAERPDESFAVNVATTHALLDQARERHARAFVFASSGAVLAGYDSRAPLGTMAPHPISVYGAQKAAAEALCQGMSQASGRCVALRFSNVYGPYSERKSSVVNAFVRRALNGDRLEIHGDGRQARDFIYVDDVVDAIIAAGRSDNTKSQYDVVHVSSGVTRPICGSEDSIVDGIEKAIAKPVDLHMRSSADSGVAYSCLNNESGVEVLGWKPRIPFDEGLARTVAWYKRHHG